MKRLLASLAIVGITALGGGATALATPASAYPPVVAPGTVNVSVTITTPSGQITVSVVGCLPQDRVQFTFGGATTVVQCGPGAPITPAIATAVMTAPAEPGVYPVTATSPGGISDSTNVTVAREPRTPRAVRTAALPATGNDDTSSTLMLAGSTLLGGLGLAGVAYRRRQTGITT